MVDVYKLLQNTLETALDDGLDVRVMQSFLGHANIQETVNTYTHIQPDTGRAQMELLAKVVNY